MIDMARLYCRDGKWKLVVESAGKHHEWPLTKERALFLMESGMEAMRAAEEEEGRLRDLLRYLANWCSSLPIKHPQQAEKLEAARKLSEY